MKHITVLLETNVLCYLPVTNTYNACVYVDLNKSLALITPQHKATLNSPEKG